MQLSELLPAVGELIPYEYAAIRKAGIRPPYCKHFIFGHTAKNAALRPDWRYSRSRKDHFLQNARWDEQLLLSVLTRLWKRCPATVDIYRLGTVEAFNRWKCRPE